MVKIVNVDGTTSSQLGTNGSSPASIPVNEVPGYTAVGVVGYRIAQYTVYAYKCRLERNGGQLQVRFGLKNVGSSAVNAGMEINANVLFVRDGCGEVTYQSS